jgi:hypothetical protein
MGAPEGAEYSEAGERRRRSTRASNRAVTRAINKEIGVRGDCSPREETLESQGNSGGTGMPQTVAKLQLHRKNSGERGAKLTGATDVAGSSTVTVEWAANIGKRRRNCLDTCTERERGREGSNVGASEQGDVDEQGAGLKRGEDVWRWSEIARSWALPRWGNVGGRLGTS